MHRPNQKYESNSSDEEIECAKRKKHMQDSTAVSKKEAPRPTLIQQLRNLPIPPKPLNDTNVPAGHPVGHCQQSRGDADTIRLSLPESQRIVQLSQSSELVCDEIPHSSGPENVAPQAARNVSSLPLVSKSPSVSTNSLVDIPQAKTSGRMINSSPNEHVFINRSPSATPKTSSVYKSTGRCVTKSQSAHYVDMEPDSEDDEDESIPQTTQPNSTTPGRPQLTRHAEHVSHSKGWNYFTECLH